MKLLFAITGLSLSLVVHGQSRNDTIQVIARLISGSTGSKIHIATYKVIKLIKGKVTKDTISVRYYFYSDYANAPDTALLNLTSYTGDSRVNDYYIFPGYDRKKGTEKVLVSTIDFKYWEDCETGKESCKPLNFFRNKEGIKWYLIMPCGGTYAFVTLSDSIHKNAVQKVNINAGECPPVFELTNLKDGKYFAYMLACGLGGGIEFRIRTETH